MHPEITPSRFGNTHKSVPWLLVVAATMQLSVCLMVITWPSVHGDDHDALATRKPLVMVGGNVQQFPVGDTLDVSGQISAMSTDSANDAFNLTHVLTGATISLQGVHSLQSGTLDSTISGVNSTALRGEVTTTLSAGGFALSNYGVEGIASGSPNTNVGMRAIATGAAGTDNRGIQVENTNSNAGATNYGVHILNNSTGASNYGIKVGALNASGVNRAIEASDGDVFLNTQSGVTQINGATTVQGTSTGAATGTFTLGIGGTKSCKIVEKHNTTATLGGNCSTGSAGAITGSDTAMTLTMGNATAACTVTFVAAYQNAPTCVISARTGANQAALVYTTSTTLLTMSTVTASAIYDVICIGH